MFVLFVINEMLSCPICDYPPRRPPLMVGLGMIYAVGIYMRLTPNYLNIKLNYNWPIVE